MATKKTSFNKTAIEKLPDDKPAVYRIETEGGKPNYIGVAKRGRVQDRIKEHIGEIPGATVRIEQCASIVNAQAKEQRAIARSKPKYNKDK